MLQVLSVVNAAQPSYNQRGGAGAGGDAGGRGGGRDGRDGRGGSSAGGRRLLVFRLTDGCRKCTAIEYEPIPRLSLDTPPGTKVLVEGARCCGGHLLLAPRACDVVGGSVAVLLASWRAQRQVMAQRSGYEAAAGAAAGGGGGGAGGGAVGSGCAPRFRSFGATGKAAADADLAAVTTRGFAAATAAAAGSNAGGADGSGGSKATARYAAELFGRSKSDASNTSGSSSSSSSSGSSSSSESGETKGDVPGSGAADRRDKNKDNDGGGGGDNNDDNDDDDDDDSSEFAKARREKVAALRATRAAFNDF
eukprot:g3166.t1